MLETIRLVIFVPVVIVISLSVYYLSSKSIIEEDIIMRKRAINLLYILLIDIILIAWSIDCKISTLFLVFFVEAIFSIGASIWIIKTKWFEIEDEKQFCYWLLEEIVKVSPENIKKFKKEMTREEQIRFLQSLSYVDVDKEETTEIKENGMKTTTIKETEVIVSLIETDEDLEEWEVVLKKR